MRGRGTMVWGALTMAAIGVAVAGLLGAASLATVSQPRSDFRMQADAPSREAIAFREAALPGDQGVSVGLPIGACVAEPCTRAWYDLPPPAAPTPHVIAGRDWLAPSVAVAMLIVLLLRLRDRRRKRRLPL
ncbi:hypothetical protein GCM10011380_22450 [Sphingomonas metalli]|uniref:Uncharacterized protein n=1 Tax=Sphingomonas metalli TaxID=1779358 RepID=A0A916T6Y2_9SPHN|nr:hypothetical protein [Sphingomonas metalli]GGB32549.1 hypothetical protein GCM10011380_22450 [Sphingomonas metalli]